MTEGQDRTDESILWFPGEPKGKNSSGEEVDAPEAPTDEEDSKEAEGK